ncbi:MAG: hypothetical protein ABW196_08715 [Solirubrobacterales bacterium]
MSGVGTFDQTGPDQVTLSWEAPDGAITEVDMSLRDAANLQSGQPVSGYGTSRRFSNPERRAALRARCDQIGERVADLEALYPQLRQPPEATP